jgi:RNA polymerase sigma-70 factor (ECF subfamily)
MDTDLVVRAQEGDQAAFDGLAMAIGERFRKVAFGILRDAGLADDATQQALLDIWRDLPQLRDPSRFEAWSYRVLVRTCYAEARRARQWLPGLSSRETERAASDERIGAVIDRDQLERGFHRLSVEQRTVLVLHYYLGLPLVRIAEVMGAPEGTIYSRVHHALRALRAALEADARPGTPAHLHQRTAR